MGLSLLFTKEAGVTGVSLLEPDLVRGAQAVAPIRVDRFGLTFRVETMACPWLTPPNFPAALRGPAELPRSDERVPSQVRAGEGLPAHRMARTGAGLGVDDGDTRRFHDTLALTKLGATVHRPQVPPSFSTADGVPRVAEEFHVLDGHSRGSGDGA
ncbi:hypothetical protein GCM10009608_71000 [Pseudonocardia alaniniphila]